MTVLSDADEQSLRLRGILLMIVAGLCFSALDTCAKLLVAEFAAIQVVFVRFLGHLLLTVGGVGPRNLPSVWRTKRPVLMIVRGLLLFGSTLGNFMALRYLALSETVSIFFSSPFLVAIIAGPILGEWIGPRRWAAVLFGFAGVLVVTQPGTAGFHWAALYSISASCCYALYAIVTRILAATDSNRAQQFYASLVGTLAFLPAMPFVWVWPQDLLSVALMAGTGVFGFVGHGFLITAHRYAPAAILSPFVYVQIIWMTLFGFAVFGHVPTTANLLGAGIVVASGLYLLFRERAVKAPQ
ncbi:DMT family transporter [Microbaculum marinisediminis]|uniref:DMT family transporter n=1 Tax=Microbaculum marinisediminis TaxID=2931392 RepID=A0AAW5QX46_9HYPH|nr:DMT family transporter [Microbaculum sp. A6E488]MCT8970978.1 DMT family transporter [Microbaculum sp. A6E488]